MHMKDKKMEVSAIENGLSLIISLPMPCLK